LLIGGNVQNLLIIILHQLQYLIRSSESEKCSFSIRAQKKKFRRHRKFWQICPKKKRGAASLSAFASSPFVLITLVLGSCLGSCLVFIVACLLHFVPAMSCIVFSYLSPFSCLMLCLLSSFVTSCST
jgi:hypothetical protein